MSFDQKHLIRSVIFFSFLFLFYALTTLLPLMRFFFFLDFTWNAFAEENEFCFSFAHFFVVKFLLRSSFVSFFFQFIVSAARVSVDVFCVNGRKGERDDRTILFFYTKQNVIKYVNCIYLRFCFFFPQK